MEQIGTIETAWRYPVKSMAGEPVAEVFVGFGGVMGDRVYAFAQSGGTAGFAWHTGRQQADLVAYRPAYLRPAATLLPVDLAASLSLGPGVTALFPERHDFGLTVTTPAGRTLPVESAELAGELAERGGKPVSLRFSDRGMTDCRPVSLFGNASVRALEQALGQPVDRRRFRANFHADWSDDRPFLEDTLVGRTLQIGERLRIVVLERDPRCKMITLDPDTGAADPAILRHVARVHEGRAGVYAAVLREGVARTGDPIRLV